MRADGVPFGYVNEAPTCCESLGFERAWDGSGVAKQCGMHWKSFTHLVLASVVLAGIANVAGCYLTHERREDAGSRPDGAMRDAGRVEGPEEAVLAFVDGNEVQLVFADGRSGPRLPYGESTIVHLRSEGTQMGGVTHRAGHLAPLVFNAFGERVRSEETSMVIDPARMRLEASAFHRGDYVFGVTHGLGGRREPLGGVLAADGVHPWASDCVPFGSSQPFGGELALACPGALQFDLHILRGTSTMAVDLGGAGVALPRTSMFDSSVFQTSRAAEDDLVLFRTERERTSMGPLALMAESSDELVVRVSEQCLRRVNKRSGESEEVCRPSTIRQAALTAGGELFVVEGDVVRTLVRVRDGVQVSDPVWSMESDLIAAGNTLAFRSLVAPNVPADFLGGRESLVWLANAETPGLFVWAAPVVMPTVRLSRDGRYAAFITRWVGRQTIDAVWFDLYGTAMHEVEARGPASGIADDFAFFHGPDVVMP